MAALLSTVVQFNDDVCKITLIVPTCRLGNLGTTNWLAAVVATNRLALVGTTINHYSMQTHNHIIHNVSVHTAKVH